jgi:hypothetical protein
VAPPSIGTIKRCYSFSFLNEPIDGTAEASAEARGAPERVNANCKGSGAIAPTAPMRTGPVGSFAARFKGTNMSAVRTPANGFQSAQRSHERYLALAQEEARSGNVVAAENYYQHAEHYFRVMSANRAAVGAYSCGHFAWLSP